MTLDAYLSMKPQYEIVPMRYENAIEVATLHSERFPRPWSAREFVNLFSQDSVFGFVARQTNAILKKSLPGFVLAREAAGEAEILTIAVSARLGRSGLGWRLMQAAMRESSQRGGEAMFLEVDAGNQPAVGLYRKLGFETVGERRAYYEDASGQKSTALVMRRNLR